jgi:hypothetical protein
MTRDEVRGLLAYFCAAYPRLELGPHTAQVWYDALQDLDGAVVTAAARRLVMRQTGAWWPTPGAVRAEVHALTTPPVPTAEAAWGAVMTAVRRYGYLQEAEALASLAPPVRVTTQAFGWQALCAGDPDVVRGQWRRLYEAYCDRAAQEAGLPPALQAGALAAARTDGPPQALPTVLARLASRASAGEA